MGGVMKRGRETTQSLDNGRLSYGSVGEMKKRGRILKIRPHLVSELSYWIAQL